MPVQMEIGFVEIIHLFLSCGTSILYLCIYTDDKQITLLWQDVLGFVILLWHKTCQKGDHSSNQSITAIYVFLELLLLISVAYLSKE